MHTPTGEAKTARAALQSIYDRVLRRIGGVKHTPSIVLLEELALSPLQVFWWQQTLEFWNTIAASPVGSLFHKCTCAPDLRPSVLSGMLHATLGAVLSMKETLLHSAVILPVSGKCCPAELLFRRVSKKKKAALEGGARRRRRL